jgi:hypothetical protein
LRPRFHEAAFGSATLGLPTYANPLTLSTLSPDSLSGFVEDHFTGGAGQAYAEGRAACVYAWLRRIH